ncbi:heat shock protein 70 (HSP70)-interacting-like protein [Leptotrombidium deliense]|uniref:RNA polymerase II-associated protein 3 n=1 Tax=Leptotrombidium deliense TaxID=299467 RepID=A0A443SPF1_9ACAR|nr:heat shock protein 70 (HSP70)-interacting-like protein [Leptotrombidium deliense]
MIANDENWKKESLKEKDKGNEWFKKGNYKQAIEHYSNAITFDGNNEVLFGNRAQCYINLNMLHEAEADCSHALRINDKFVKGYFRRGIARKLLNKHVDAYSDFNTVLQMEPNNKQAREELAIVKKVLGPKHAKITVDTKPKRNKLEAMDVEMQNENRREIKYTVTLPKELPKTSFEFYCHWRELKKEEGNDLKLEYISKIGAHSFAAIFDKSIEPEVFSEILFVLELSNDFEFVFSLLSNFTRTTRFGSLILFLGEAEKETLRKLFTKVIESGKYNEDEVKQIADKYCIG